LHFRELCRLSPQANDPKARLKKMLAKKRSATLQGLIAQDQEEYQRHRDKFGNQWQYY
jgi:hypothetical protein